MISNIATSISSVGAAPAAVEAPREEPQQAKLAPAQIRRSITQDKLISFEDGKGYKTLRRHLTVKGLTPDEYRSKWGLPKDYPMVSPAYSEARSSMAKARGFGRPASAAPAMTTQPAAAAEALPPAAAAARAARKVSAKSAAKSNGKARGPGRPAKAKAAPESAS